VAPAVFRADTTEVLSIAILNPTASIRVEARLYNKKGHLVSNTSHDIFGEIIRMSMSIGLVGNIQ